MAARPPEWLLQCANNSPADTWRWCACAHVIWQIVTDNKDVAGAGLCNRSALSAVNLHLFERGPLKGNNNWNVSRPKVVLLGCGTTRRRLYETCLHRKSRRLMVTLVRRGRGCVCDGDMLWRIVTVTFPRVRGWILMEPGNTISGWDRVGRWTEVYLEIWWQWVFGLI